MKNDRMIQLGHAIAHGLDLICLMEHYDMTADEIKYFHEKHIEFLTVYESGCQEHMDLVSEYFKKLKDLTGYEIMASEDEKDEG